MLDEFEAHLRRENLSENTISSYLLTIRMYRQLSGEITKQNLLAFKGYLIETYKPKTVNLRIQAINKYLDFIKKEKLRLAPVKIQQKNFLQIKVEHVFNGYFDLYSKGGKLRRLYIPKKLKTETETWLAEKGVTSGYLFLNRFGDRITVRGISQQLKNYAHKYGLNPKVVYPHSFRHRFAKNFLEKYNDISLLADLMGHESIETTHIYLRKTASEQQEIVDKVVTW